MAAQVALAFIKLVYLIRLKKGIVVWGGGSCWEYVKLRQTQI